MSELEESLSMYSVRCTFIMIGRMIGWGYWKYLRLGAEKVNEGLNL